MTAPALASGQRHQPLSLRALLAVAVFAAFLTQTKLIPGIETNFGIFETVSLLVFLGWIAGLFGPTRLYARHPIVITLLVMVLAAAVSQVNVPADRWKWSFIDLAILAFLLVWILVIYNLVVAHRIRPVFFLRWVTYSILIIGPWIAYQGITTGGEPGAVGPFRNRAHMAFYMLTGFWLVLMYRFWPGISAKQRWASHVAMSFAIYAVAVSGRRSVYLAMFVGLLALGISFLAAGRGRKTRFVTTGAFVIAIVALFYVYGAAFFPRATFFQERVHQIGYQLRSAISPPDEVSGEESFIALQRQGALLAFRSSPLIGIGWGGFYRSQYSPTGHEVHSTPLRFLAELGMIGVAVYLSLMGYLLYHATRLALRMRSTPWGNVYLVMALALWSMSVSYLYNRHVTERTFWLLLIVFLSLELFSRDYIRYLRKARRGARGAWRQPAAAACLVAARIGGPPTLASTPGPGSAGGAAARTR